MQRGLMHHLFLESFFIVLITVWRQGKKNNNNFLKFKLFFKDSKLEK
jgi:hypothetical protein